LAFTGVEVRKLLDQIAVAPDGGLHQVSAPLIGDAGRLGDKEAGNSLFVTGKQQRFQSLLGKQSRPGLAG
jgi:hypothetical protein